jgi:hypothetical protein
VQKQYQKLGQTITTAFSMADEFNTSSPQQERYTDSTWQQLCFTFSGWHNLKPASSDLFKETAWSSNSKTENFKARARYALA